MCGRFTLTTASDAVRAFFSYTDVEPFPARYNIAPTQPVMIVRTQSTVRQSALVRWGFLPSWVKDPGEFSLLINARSETAATKPSFKSAMKHRRCLFPVSGYYEWLRTPEGKQPYYISPADGGVMGVAGLWETWCDPDGGDIDTALLMTTPANRQLSIIHHRMPAIIRPEDFDVWLDTGNPRQADARSLLRPFEDGFLNAVPVSTRVNNAAFDDSQLIEPIPLEECIAVPKPSAKASTATKPKSSAQLDLF
ncbi:MAG: SOS response-associated peptidase [Rhodobacteraceae bacterium]|nr:SOS response-associated peptidase [Paracoccaceae bacterium]